MCSYTILHTENNVTVFTRKKMFWVTVCQTVAGKRYGLCHNINLLVSFNILIKVDGYGTLQGKVKSEYCYILEVKKTRTIVSFLVL